MAVQITNYPGSPAQPGAHLVVEGTTGACDQTSYTLSMNSSPITPNPNPPDCSGGRFTIKFVAPPCEDEKPNIITVTVRQGTGGGSNEDVCTIVVDCE